MCNCVRGSHNIITLVSVSSSIYENLDNYSNTLKELSQAHSATRYLDACNPGNLQAAVPVMDETVQPSQ